jgi:hypothetical protein
MRPVTSTERNVSTTPLATHRRLYADARQHAEQTLAHRLNDLQQMLPLLARFEPLAAQLTAAGVALHASQLMSASVWVNGKRCKALSVLLAEAREQTTWLRALHACGWKLDCADGSWSVVVRHGSLLLRLYAVSPEEAKAVWAAAQAARDTAAA